MISVRGSGGSHKIIIPTSVKVTAPPNKTTYTAGEQLDLTGMVVTAEYSDGTTKDITTECTFTPAVGTTLYEDTTKIDIAWEWESQITYAASQAVTVNRVLQSIAITAPPTKTAYNKNETLDLAGMVVTATFTSGQTAAVTGYTTSPAAGAALGTLGSQAVTVSYTERGVTKTASFTVSVSVKIVTWASGTDQEIADMVAAHDAGTLNLQDYWAVGQERSVSLAAMAATGVGESHAAQTVTLVLSNAGGKTLENGKACAFQVDQKHSLSEAGYMNSSDTNSGGWNGSARRTWCNGAYRNAIPATLRPIFKKFKNLSGTGGGSSSGTQETLDYFALRAEVEIFGSTTYSVAGEGSQVQLYKTASNRVKKLGNAGSAYGWWERSPRSGGSAYFCRVVSDGTASLSFASYSSGLAPFGCI